MARKPARMYREIKGQAYTRREYMGGVPASRIIQYDMGETTGDFPIQVSLKAKEPCQIRHTSMEAARIAANRLLSKRVGTVNYHLKIRIYPHHVLRENKLATGAGADRVSSGMRHAFGKNVGTAARVNSGQTVMTVWTYPNQFNLAKEALWRASMKLTTPCSIEIEKGEELIPKS
ncbi:MAG: 50S ribosomal protein L16 [Methanomassiliicoccales archaeon]|nr:50S ribosomal protein L16 [Methanomassiliicoccales archaeon]NYT14670.1 50S ribosomal protein L16 [Methanomassiliicoccales archaeon]